MESTTCRELSSPKGELEHYFDKEVLAVASHTHFDHEFSERLCHPAEAAVLAISDNHNSVAELFMDPEVLKSQGYPVINDPDIWLKKLPWDGYRSEEHYRVRPAPATHLMEEGDVMIWATVFSRYCTYPGIPQEALRCSKGQPESYFPETQFVIPVIGLLSTFTITQTIRNIWSQWHVFESYLYLWYMQDITVASERIA